MRLNRLASDHTIDGYLTTRIEAAIERLERTGIKIEDSTGDSVFVADFVVWEYQNRDNDKGIQSTMVFAKLKN